MFEREQYASRTTGRSWTALGSPRLSGNVENIDTLKDELIFQSINVFLLKKQFSKYIIMIHDVQRLS